MFLFLSLLSLSLLVAVRRSLLVTRLFSRSLPGHGELLTFRRGAAPVPAKSPDVLRCLLMPAWLPTMFDPIPKQEGMGCRKRNGDGKKERIERLKGIKEKVQQSMERWRVKQGVNRSKLDELEEKVEGILYYWRCRRTKCRGLFFLLSSLHYLSVSFIPSVWFLQFVLQSLRQQLEKRTPIREHCTLGYCRWG